MSGFVCFRHDISVELYFNGVPRFGMSVSTNEKIQVGTSDL
jgi:hypothetical protein